MSEVAVDTVGKIALDLQKKGDLQTDSIELQREIHKGSNSKKTYEEEVWECIARGKADTSIEGDFYIIVIFKKERLLHTVVRQLFFYRQTCPTPDYDQTVYKYHRLSNKPEYLWTIPNNAACRFLPLMQDLPSDQLLLRDMVCAFNRGDLDKLSKKLNKELV